MLWSYCRAFWLCVGRALVGASGYIYIVSDSFWAPFDCALPRKTLRLSDILLADQGVGRATAYHLCQRQWCSSNRLAPSSSRLNQRVLLSRTKASAFPTKLLQISVVGT